MWPREEVESPEAGIAVMKETWEAPLGSPRCVLSSSEPTLSPLLSLRDDFLLYGTAVQLKRAPPSVKCNCVTSTRMTRGSP